MFRKSYFKSFDFWFSYGKYHGENIEFEKKSPTEERKKKKKKNSNARKVEKRDENALKKSWQLNFRKFPIL